MKSASFASESSGGGSCGALCFSLGCPSDRDLASVESDCCYGLADPLLVGDALAEDTRSTQQEPTRIVQRAIEVLAHRGNGTGWNGSTATLSSWASQVY